MLFIIEGLDKTGKTTLARALSQVIGGAEIRHASKPIGHPLDDYEVSLDAYRPCSDHLILDRFHVGELVWPRVFMRESEFDQPMYRHVEMFLHSRGAVVIRAERDLELLKNELDDEPINEFQAELADGLFRGAHLLAACPRIPYDYTNGGASAALMVSVALMQQGRSRRIFNITDEWIGSPRPSRLLVGERPGPQQDGRAYLNVPFMPYRGTSGHFLMDELDGAPWWNWAICNAYKADGSPERLHDLWTAFGKPEVVALGNIAAEALKYEMVPCFRARHPQYARRFERRNGPGAYGRTVLSPAAVIE